MTKITEIKKKSNNEIKISFLSEKLKTVSKICFGTYNRLLYLLNSEKIKYLDNNMSNLIYI